MFTPYHRLPLLNPGEKPIFTSGAQLRDRGGLFSSRVKLKPRILVMTDQSRLLCIKLSTPSPTVTPATSQTRATNTRARSVSIGNTEASRRPAAAKLKNEILLVRPSGSALVDSTTATLTAAEEAIVTSSAVPITAGQPSSLSSSTGARISAAFRSRRGSSNTTTGDMPNPNKRRLSVSTTASRMGLGSRANVKGANGKRRQSVKIELMSGLPEAKSDGSLIIRTSVSLLS